MARTVFCNGCSNLTEVPDGFSGPAIPCAFCNQPLDIATASGSTTTMGAPAAPAQNYQNCPQCGNLILAGTSICPHCNTTLQRMSQLGKPGEFDLFLPDDAFAGGTPSPSPSPPPPPPPMQDANVWQSYPQISAYPETPAYPQPGFGYPEPAPGGSGGIIWFILGAFLAVVVTAVLIVVLLGPEMGLKLPFALNLFGKKTDKETATKATASKATATPTTTASGKEATTPEGTIPMPPPKIGGKATVSKKIEPPVLAKRAFKSKKAMLQVMAKDLQAFPPAGQKSQRYFTLVHLHNNPAISSADLQKYRTTLQGLMESLTGKSGLLKPVDADVAIYRFDLQEAGWDANNHWRKMLKSYPYGLTLDTVDGLADIAKLITGGTDVKVPWVRADWFIASATDPPLSEVFGQMESKPGLESEIAQLKTRYEQPLDLQTATYELDLKDSKLVQKAVKENKRLMKLGLEPLSRGQAVDRQTWVRNTGLNATLYQDLAFVLDLGSPFRPTN